MYFRVFFCLGMIIPSLLWSQHDQPKNNQAEENVHRDEFDTFEALPHRLGRAVGRLIESMCRRDPRAQKQECIDEGKRYFLRQFSERGVDVEEKLYRFEGLSHLLNQKVGLLVEGMCKLDSGREKEKCIDKGERYYYRALAEEDCGSSQGCTNPVLENGFIIYGDRVGGIGFEDSFPFQKYGLLPVKEAHFLGKDEKDSPDSHYGVWRCQQYGKKRIKCTRNDFWDCHAVWKVREETYEQFHERQAEFRKKNCTHDWCTKE